jgi:4-amino-4-deoxy-L-arabinose transferase-like glycosyltransferase
MTVPGGGAVAGLTWRMAGEGLRLVMPAAAVVLLIVAWRLARAGRDTRALVLVLAASLLFRAFAAGDLYLHEWDERYHALVAKHLMQDPLRPTLYADPVLDYNYRNWTGNHVWLHKPPLALWLMAFAMKLGGVNELAARVPNVALSTFGVYLTFLTGRLLFGSSVGLAAAALQGMNGLLLDLAAGRRASDHVDTTLLFFVALGSYAIALDLVRPRWRTIVAIGLCTGCAWLTKSYVALLIPALWLATAIGRQEPAVMLRRFLVLLGVAAALAVPWHVHVASHFAREAAWESQYALRHLHQALEHHAHPFYWYVKRLGRDFGELTYIPLVWFVASLGARWRRPEERLLLVWLLLPLGVFSAAATKLPGYLVVSAPAIFLIEGLFVHRTYDWMAARRIGGPRRVLLATLVTLLFLLPLRYTGERLLVAPSQPRNPVWAERLRALDACIGPGKAVVFGSTRPIEAMFYGSHSVYEGVPGADTIQSLVERGYRVVILGSAERGAAAPHPSAEVFQPAPLAAGGWRPCRQPPDREP